jgi:hypothetical protein
LIKFMNAQGNRFHVSCVSDAFSLELRTIFESTNVVQHKTGTLVVFGEFKTMLKDQINAHIKMLY